MISFRAFRSGHGLGLAVDFVSTVGVCAFSERMEEAAGPILRRIPQTGSGAASSALSERLVPRALCWTCQNQQRSANEGKPVSAYLYVLGANCIKCVAQVI